MKEPSPENWMDLYLDGELTVEDRLRAESRLEADPSAAVQWDAARSLDEKLRQLLQPPELDVIPFVARIQEVGSPRAVKPTRKESDRPTLAVMLAVVVVILAGFVLVAGNRAGVATLTYSTGPVEIRAPHQLDWRVVRHPYEVRLVAGTRVRTPVKSLCEVTTDSLGVIRIHQDSEIVVNHADEVELRAGQFWCHSSSESPVKVRVATGIEGPRNPPEARAALDRPSLFTCAQNSKTVWQQDQQTTRCISADEQPAEVRTSGNQSWTIDPGFSIACSPGEAPQVFPQHDWLLASSWQLPLLARRSARDPELQSMLRALLITVGQTKMGNLYDDQIRELGPVGTIPLIAYVRSQASRSEPSIRVRAMRIVSDLAPDSCVGELSVLARDSDPNVSRLARIALERLRP